MFFKSPTGIGVFSLLLLLFVSAGFAHAQTVPQDSLQLYTPENLSFEYTKIPGSTNYIVYLTWDDIPDSKGALIHQPDLSEWSVVTPEELLSTPVTVGAYSGSIDRTVVFRALTGGTVGNATPIDIRFDIVGEEEWRNIINIGEPYTPGDTIDCIFAHQSIPDTTRDLGIKLVFSEGIIDSNGTMYVGCEDFEGFHVWRGTRSDGSDMQAILELSKEKAFKGTVSFVGIPLDSIYFADILPSVQATGAFYFPPEWGVGIPGFVLDAPLTENRFFGWDFNGFNGFTYYYAVSSFDRGYNVRSGRQGLVKINSFDSIITCNGDTIPPDKRLPYPRCPDTYLPVTISVPAQSDMYQIYAVPNPFRDGGSAVTTPNYHNFPDNSIRFVNVPAQCRLAIYTTAGDLVWETYHEGNTGNIQWDTRNEAGEEVSSGIYVYKVENRQGGGHMYGRLVIIR